jgi:hypothetical protein
MRRESLPEEACFDALDAFGARPNTNAGAFAQRFKLSPARFL